MPEIVREAALFGSLRAGDTLRGTITADASLSGKMTAPVREEIETYDGDYAVTPKLYDDVILPTKDRRMKADVTVLKIPQFETSNESGGKTLFIGG